MWLAWFHEAKLLQPIMSTNSTGYSTIRYDTRFYFNVRSKADISQLNLPHVFVTSCIITICHVISFITARCYACIRGTSHGPVSVRLSVTSRCSTKTAKRRIT